MTYRQYKEKKAHDDAVAQESGAVHVNGQASDANQRSISQMMQPTTNGSLPTEMMPPPPRQSHSMADSPIVDRTVLPNGHAHPTGADYHDVEMRG